jgi:hypothetical protein
MVRRLPVLQNKPADDAALRPAWQWVLIGAGFSIALWMPLVAVCVGVRNRLAGKTLAESGAELAAQLHAASAFERLLWALSVLAPVLAPWALACGFAGGVLGRFATTTERRHAAYSGLVAAGTVVGLSMIGGSLSSPAVLVSSASVLALSAAGASWFGAKLGRRRIRGA